jgi:hypothetical protein
MKDFRRAPRPARNLPYPGNCAAVPPITMGRHNRSTIRLQDASQTPRTLLSR